MVRFINADQTEHSTRPIGEQPPPERDEQERPFIVKSEKAFTALRFWLREHGCNCYHYSGRRYIQVGYDAKPGALYGDYSNRGFIVVCDDSLFERTCEEIEKGFIRNKALGWEE